MKRILYLLTLLFCLAGCKKEEVKQRLEVTRVSFINQSFSSPYIKYDGQEFQILDNIPITYGDKKFEVYNGLTGEKVIDTVLNITGPQSFYVYQPFDIVSPVIVSALPTVPPVDPRNPLKNETPAPEGYVKIKVAFQTQFILPGQNVELILLSKTAASPDVAVPIETLQDVNMNYNTTFFEVKRPVLADGTLSQDFSFSLIDPATGERIKTSNGNDYASATLTLPLGEKNLFMFYFNDRQNASRFSAVSIPVNDLYYVIFPTLLWYI